jgi:hypothetical protein
MATVCHADATRIGIGSLQSCILSGPEWRICLVAGTDNDVVGFFDASVPEEALEGELSSMMASVQA